MCPSRQSGTKLQWNQTWLQKPIHAGINYMIIESDFVIFQQAISLAVVNEGRKQMHSITISHNPLNIISTKSGNYIYLAFMNEVEKHFWWLS